MESDHFLKPECEPSMPPVDFLRASSESSDDSEQSGMREKGSEVQLISKHSFLPKKKGPQSINPIPSVIPNDKQNKRVTWHYKALCVSVVVAVSALALTIALGIAFTLQFYINKTSRSVHLKDNESRIRLDAKSPEGPTSYGQSVEGDSRFHYFASNGTLKYWRRDATSDSDTDMVKALKSGQIIIGASGVYTVNAQATLFKTRRTLYSLFLRAHFQSDSRVSAGATMYPYGLRRTLASCHEGPMPERSEKGENRALGVGVLYDQHTCTFAVPLRVRPGERAVLSLEYSTSPPSGDGLTVFVDEGATFLDVLRLEM